MKKAFNIATPDGPKEVQATIALLPVGNRKHRFAIHESNGRTMLSDYRSGYGVASLDAIFIERMARISSYTKTTPRQAAEIVLARIISKAGLEKVEAQLSLHPTINA